MTPNRMALTLRTPLGVLARIAAMQAHLTALKLATADWVNSGPPAIWLNFDAVEDAELAINNLAKALPGEVTDQLKMLDQDGMTIEEILVRRRGSQNRGDKLDLALLAIPDPNAKVRKQQKDHLKKVTAERKKEKH